MWNTKTNLNVTLKLDMSLLKSVHRKQAALELWLENMQKDV